MMYINFVKISYSILDEYIIYQGINISKLLSPKIDFYQKSIKIVLARAL